ncbi:hypothetical protein VNO77_21600 [Canavalia gladiata]|uniref:N-acetyltransferase domain-containing protein n=1 Tax=Canavalia gladiata TaxID=3824 RepID=A0AAN9LWG4_CANGL
MAIDPSRVCVRAFKLNDADDVLLWAGDDRVTQNTRLKTCGSKEEVLAFIRDEWIYPLWRSICLDDRSIGIVWVLPWPGEERYRADLGYALGANYWGQGIATTVVRIVLSQVFHHFPYLKRLQAFSYVHNKASQRVLEKVGFHREGVLRKFFLRNGNLEDLCIHSFLPTDQIIY